MTATIGRKVSVIEGGRLAPEFYPRTRFNNGYGMLLA